MRLAQHINLSGTSKELHDAWEEEIIRFAGNYVDACINAEIYDYDEISAMVRCESTQRIRLIDTIESSYVATKDEIGRSARTQSDIYEGEALDILREMEDRAFVDFCAENSRQLYEKYGQKHSEKEWLEIYSDVCNLYSNILLV